MTTNSDHFTRAKQFIVGGVNSPARSFKAVGGTPKFIARAQGPFLWDEEGRQYIDYVGSWGPMILGHGPQVVKDAITAQVAKGISFGAPCVLETRLAEIIQRNFPTMERLRFVNSGTEACMSAVRVARAFTKRDKVIKFEGCYHGHADFFLSKAGSGLATLGEPSSAGVPREVAATTLNARFNDLASVENLFTRNAEEVAAVIVEPVVGNMGCVPPDEGFLPGLRDLCRRNGAVLIFDEVMTGFRVDAGGAQRRFAVAPDLVTLGKVIGAGMPVGAYGGRAEIMNLLAPLGPVYQAGTLSGNPLAMAAGCAQLDHLLAHDREHFAQLERLGELLEAGVMAHARAKNYPVSYNRCGSMATLFFTRERVRSWEDAATCDTEKFARYFWLLMDAGIHMPPSQFEAFFLSTTHTEEMIHETARQMCAALDKVFA